MTLISQSRLESLKQQKISICERGEAAEKDKSGIRVYLKYLESERRPLPPYIMRYKNFLLSFFSVTDYLYLNILAMSLHIASLSFHRTGVLSPAKILHMEEIFKAVGEIPPNDNLFANINDPWVKEIISEEIFLIQAHEQPFLFFYFVQECAKEQKKLIEEKNKLLRAGVFMLDNDQIICPLKNSPLFVSQSLASAKEATAFLAIFIVLCQSAGVEDEAIRRFIASQPVDYLSKAEQLFIRYVRKPEGFCFSAEQEQFLREIGAKEAAKQFLANECYEHLWDAAKSFKENTLTLLKDYGKKDWLIPDLGLFFTGHWGRKNHKLIEQATTRIEASEETQTVLADLQTALNALPSFNPKGSTARRLGFLADRARGIEPAQLFEHEGQSMGNV